MCRTPQSTTQHPTTPPTPPSPTPRKREPLRNRPRSRLFTLEESDPASLRIVFMPFSCRVRVRVCVVWCILRVVCCVVVVGRPQTATWPPRPSPCLTPDTASAFQVCGVEVHGRTAPPQTRHFRSPRSRRMPAPFARVTGATQLEGTILLAAIRAVGFFARLGAERAGTLGAGEPAASLFGCFGWRTTRVLDFFFWTARRGRYLRTDVLTLVQNQTKVSHRHLPSVPCSIRLLRPYKEEHV